MSPGTEFARDFCAAARRCACFYYQSNYGACQYQFKTSVLTRALEQKLNKEKCPKDLSYVENNIEKTSCFVLYSREKRLCQGVRIHTHLCQL